jgi:hypothetical protein
MRTWAYVLVLAGGVLQFVGVALVFYEIQAARTAGAKILTERGQPPADFRRELRDSLAGGIGGDATQALADIVVLRDRLNEYLSTGLWQRVLAAVLVLTGIAVSTGGAVLALAAP